MNNYVTLYWFYAEEFKYFWVIFSKLWSLRLSWSQREDWYNYTVANHFIHAQQDRKDDESDRGNMVWSASNIEIGFFHKMDCGGWGVNKMLSSDKRHEFLKQQFQQNWWEC